MDDHEVTVQRLAETRFRLHYLNEGVVVLVDRLRDTADGLRAELSIMDVTGSRLHFGSYNLLSGQWRKAVAQACNQQLRAQWTALLDDLCLRIVQHWREPQAPVSLAEVPVHPEQYLVWPLLLREAPTILYGDGGTGKSLIALALGAEVASGHVLVPGTRLETHPGPTLYLDWEDSPAVHRARLDRMCRAAGIDMPRELWHLSMHAPLPDAVDHVEEFVRTHGVGLVVVDSLALAAGADPWAAEPTLRVYRALRRLGCSSLIIAHVSKADLNGGGDRRPYGTVFSRNAARSAWEVQQSRSDDGRLGLLLKHTKSNWGPLHRPLAMLVEFDDGIRLAASTVSQLAEETDMDRMDRRDLVLDLVRNRGSVSAKEVAQVLGVSESSARNLLHRLKARGLVWSVEDPGQPTRWVLPAKRHHREEDVPSWV